MVRSATTAVLLERDKARANARDHARRAELLELMERDKARDAMVARQLAVLEAEHAASVRERERLLAEQDQLLQQRLHVEQFLAQLH